LDKTRHTEIVIRLLTNAYGHVSPFDAHCCHMGKAAIKHPIWASECLDVKNYKWRLNPVWHRMLYSSFTHMATVGVKQLT